MFQLLAVATVYSTTTLSEKEITTIHQYYIDIKRDPKKYRFEIEKLGESTSIIYAYRKGFSPSIATRYIYFGNGRVAELTTRTLTWAYTADLEQIVPSMKIKEIISQFVKHDVYSGITIISSIEDIPNYSENPLDPDLESSVREIYKLSETIYVVYYYQHLGGSVYRYRFEFRKSGGLEKVSRILLGTAIGRPSYNE